MKKKEILTHLTTCDTVWARPRTLTKLTQPHRVNLCLKHRTGSLTKDCNADLNGLNSKDRQASYIIHLSRLLLDWPPRAHLHVVEMLRFMSGISQPSLPTPFHSVLASIYVFMALSTVFHSINSSDNFPFSDSVLLVLSLPYWSFQLYISLWKSPSALI